MKVQADVSEEINKKLKFYKIENNLQTLGEAVTRILNKYFEEKKK